MDEVPLSCLSLLLDADDYLLALDAKDEHMLWAKQIADSKDGYFVSMPPLVHGDMVTIFRLPGK